MDADERALRILEEFARAPREVGRVTLAQDYLDRISKVESLHENRSGADKSARHRADVEFRNHYRRVQRP